MSTILVHGQIIIQRYSTVLADKNVVKKTMLLAASRRINAASYYTTLAVVLRSEIKF